MYKKIMALFMTKSTTENKYNKEGAIWKSCHKWFFSQVESIYKLASSNKK